MGEISSIRVLFVRKAVTMYKIKFILNDTYTNEQELIIKEKDLIKTLLLLTNNNYVILRVRWLERKTNND